MKPGTRKVVLAVLSVFMLVGLALVQPLSTHAASGSSAHLALKKGIAKANSGGGLPLVYLGGPVMENQAKVYVIFWEPKGSFVSPRYNALIKRYFNDVGFSGLYHNNRQYKDSKDKAPKSAVLAGTFVDARPYPTNPMFDSDIQSEVTVAQAVKGWKPAVNHVFFVFLAFGEDLCFNNSNICFSNVFCGYHGSFGTNIYSAMPYVNTFPGCNVPSSPNQNIDADSTINVASHEQNESATDPYVNVKTAWVDANGNEIGDKCNFTFGPQNSQGGDVIFDGHPYMVQEEWDNAQGGCVLKGP